MKQFRFSPCYQIFANRYLLGSTGHAAGEQHYIQIELDLMRLAAIYLTERMRARLMPYMLMRLSQQTKKTGQLHSHISRDSR